MTDFFSPDYFAARDRFRSGVLSNGGKIESIVLNATGPGGRDLTIDIGWFGPASPGHVFIHSSGIHGVEGFAGSAIQLQWLAEGMPKLADDHAIALVHAVNPFGMTWLRLANENNVDLNHNFLASDEEYSAAAEQYAGVNALLNPASAPSGVSFFQWMPKTLAEWKAAAKALSLGRAGLQRVIGDGQYRYPKGLCFGGERREQATRRLQLYLSTRLAFAERLIAVDVHTGPGQSGEDTLLVDGSPDRRAHAADMQRAYGNRVRPISGNARGTLDGLLFRMFPGAKVYFAVQDFGACNEIAALNAARDENRQHHYGDPSLLTHGTKQRLLRTFCPSDPEWRRKVLARGREVIAQGLALAFDLKYPVAVSRAAAGSGTAPRQLPGG